MKYVNWKYIDILRINPIDTFYTPGIFFLKTCECNCYNDFLINCVMFQGAAHESLH